MAIEYVIDGGGSVITAGTKGYLEVPFNCSINAWTVVGDVAGTIVIPVKNCTYANFPTTYSLSGTEAPSLNAAQKGQDTNLTTWSYQVNAGDILEFSVNATPATVTKVTVSLKAVRTV
jgi:hypothetical protein